jgi:hypothetical protein
MGGRGVPFEDGTADGCRLSGDDAGREPGLSASFGYATSGDAAILAPGVEQQKLLEDGFSALHVKACDT